MEHYSLAKALLTLRERICLGDCKVLGSNHPDNEAFKVHRYTYIDISNIKNNHCDSNNSGTSKIKHDHTSIKINM